MLTKADGTKVRKYYTKKAKASGIEITEGMIKDLIDNCESVREAKIIINSRLKSE